MKKITLFSWGYWGWGNSSDQFVKAVDKVENSRDFSKPIFVDIRIRRSGRAADFIGNAFEKIVGKKRYLWMEGLGNLAIVDKKLKKITIKEPALVETLLDFAIDSEKNKQRVIFFCSCGEPRWCHRHVVGTLLLKAARKRGLNLEVVEWPGGEPQQIIEEASPEIIKRMENQNLQVLPISAIRGLEKYASLPWGSVVELSGAETPQYFITGPAVYKRGSWGLEVVYFYGLAKNRVTLLKKSLVQRRVRGYGSRK